MVSALTIEFALKRGPASGAHYYLVQAIGNFSGYIQNLANNQQVGVVSDMTTMCILPSA